MKIPKFPADIKQQNEHRCAEEFDPAVNDKEAATFYFSRGEALRRDSTVCDSRAFSRIVCSLDFNEAVRGIIARERRSKNADIPIVALASNLRDQRS